jgi:endo-1,4-beta-xylanase
MVENWNPKIVQWDSTEPSQGQFSYSGGDEIVNLARSNNQLVRCHTLVWHNQLPSWVTNGNFDNSTLVSILKTHIQNVVTHYKGKCYSWDVVNEGKEDDENLQI